EVEGAVWGVADGGGGGRLALSFRTSGGPGSGKINRLYKNVTRDGVLKFKDVTEGSGLGIDGYNTGVIVGDVNNDGLPDVVVTQYGGVRLFLNQGNGTFKDVTQDAGLKNPLWAASANLFDFDRDGYLDLVVVNYLVDDPTHVCLNKKGERTYCGPLMFPGTVTKLFRNLGRDGKGVRFEDVTVKAGLAAKTGTGLGVYCADFTGGGWPDIFIANHAKPNHLWVNQKDSTFKEEAYPRGIAVAENALPQAGMGVAVGDVDGDGLLDVYVTHLAIETNTLWKQGPERGTFTDRTGRCGLL